MRCARKAREDLALGLFDVIFRRGSGFDFQGHTRLLLKPFQAPRDLQALLAGVVAGHGDSVRLDGQLAAATALAAEAPAIAYILCKITDAGAVEGLNQASGSRGLSHVLCV